jgi:NTP pyrophosphatase (non-canonical NTP hydrolase)
MNLTEYKEEVKRTLPHLSLQDAHLDIKLLDNLHMILGMQTEVSELADVFKKNLAYNKPLDWVNIEEELADILWYLVNFANINNLNIEKSMETNINKLRTRFPHKFEANLAINKDINLERDVLEKGATHQ